MAKPDTEWLRELVQQVRAEFASQPREQRKTLQHLITGTKELIEKSARRAASEEPSAKRARPASVEISSNGDERPEMRSIALLVAEASGVLDILVGVPVAEPAEAPSTPRVTESVEASEETQPVKLPCRQRFAAPSLSAVVGLYVAEKPAPVSVASATPRSRIVIEEIHSETAVHSAMQQLLEIVEAARQLRPEVGLRDLR